MYVVQQHAASRLHYDFRLELDGTLKSWAVPKGPSLNPADKRLAVHVEDHPMEYAAFEGIIPPKQYGAGTVMVWDQGQWEPDGDPRTAYHKGRMKFSLFGKKLQGRWALVRMSGTQNADGKNWLLIKERDQYARTATRANSNLTSSRSVKSGRSMDEITKAKADVWHSRRTSGDAEHIKISRNLNTKRGASTSKDTVKCPERISPQLATLIDEIPEGEGWVHELKYDGYRMLCRIEQGGVQLFSRTGREWTKKLPEQVKAAGRLSLANAWLDGELVALRPDGSMSFQALQNAFDRGWNGRLVYYVFDLLFFNGRDLRPSPLHERKRLLASLLRGQAEAGPLQYSAHIVGQGPIVFETACRRGLEGLIAKRVDGQYAAGRNRNWIKVKCHRRQEFVIGGYTEPSGSRRGFGALLLGVYEKPGHLVYVGRVGTGFSEDRLFQLHRILQRHERSRPAFVDPPTGGNENGVHWVKPELVAEVRFAEWTQEGLLRQAAFLGLRDDKPAKTIVRESAVHGAAAQRTVDRLADKPVHKSKRAVARVPRSSPPRQDRKSTHAAMVAGIEITNPYKVLFPHDGITKLELAQYYERIGDTILPQVRGRPLTLLRCPEGFETGCFYQRHATEQIHDAIDRVEVEESDGRASYMVANTIAAVVAFVQLGVLEFHTWGAKQDRLDHPDRMVLDLDPALDVPWREVVEAAFLIKTLLEELSLKSFVKTTGGKGLHVVVPLQRRHSWDEVKDFAKSVAVHMVRAIPARFTDNMSKRVREGKVYIDYLRNGRGATIVAAYSTRAKPRAPLSVPLAWDELTPSLRADQFTLQNIEERLLELAKDPWGEYEKVQQHLTVSMMAALGIQRRL